MDWSGFDFWKFLAGLGIFMFGMFLLEEAIKQLSGKAFKTLIRKSTTGKIRSIFTGLFSTAILQSSSAVSLMTLTFVGAGMISMQNAIGVILGTNLGTTATGWLVATIGFKINIEGLFLPLLALGGLGLIFMHNASKYAGISKLLVGLGFLFMGLDYMKLSVELFTDGFDIATLPKYGLWFYAVIAIVLTSLMQSSSATIAIILTALNSGILGFNEGAAMIIGSNIGTTTTVMLGTLGGIPLKKQVALSHLVFNLFTGIVAIVFLPLLVKVIFLFFDPNSNEVLGVTLFHTLFNLLGVILFFPFIGALVKWLQKIYPEKVHKTTKYINNISSDLPEAAEIAVKNETIHAFQKTLKMISTLLNLDEIKSLKDSRKKPEFFKLKKTETFAKVFDDVQQINKEIIVFASHIHVDQLEANMKEIHTQTNYVVMVLSQVSKTLSGIAQEVEDIEQSSNKKVSEIFSQIKENTLENLLLLNELLEKKQSLETFELYYNQINNDYKIIVDSVTQAIDSKKIEEKHISSLLIINGFLTQSIRQLLKAVEKLY
jgi:phosphate:Na+ symporter